MKYGGCLNYVHHIPGRLRVRTDRLRHNGEAAERLRSRLSGVAGVRCADVNPVTGSALIHYDPNAAKLPDLLAAVREFGRVDERTLSTGASRGAASAELPATIGKAVAKTVGAYLLQTAVERSVVALVAALV